MTVQINATEPPIFVSLDDVIAEETNGPKKDNSKRRTTPTPPTKQLLARIKGYEEASRSADTKIRGGYHKPGSMQKRSK
jgi:hypothetical protein